MRAKPAVAVAVLDYTVLVVALAGALVQLFTVLLLSVAGTFANLRGRSDADDLRQLHDLKISVAVTAAAMFTAAVCAFGSVIAESWAARAELPLRVLVVLSSFGALGLVAVTYADLQVEWWFGALVVGLPATAAIVGLVAFGLSRRRPRPSPA